MLASIVHPDIKRLWEYDIRTNNDYCKTLFVYLTNGKSLTETGEVLCFHKNTIGYRINQIKEIIQNDLNDWKDNMNYLSSLSVVEYLKNRD